MCSAGPGTPIATGTGKADELVDCQDLQWLIGGTSATTEAGKAIAAHWQQQIHESQMHVQEAIWVGNKERGRKVIMRQSGTAIRSEAEMWS